MFKHLLLGLALVVSSIVGASLGFAQTGACPSGSVVTVVNNYVVGSACTPVTTAIGTLGVANGGTGLTSGTSGGVLGFTAAGTLASSTALAANGLVIGGGAGATPTSITAGTNGQIPVGATAGAPVMQTLGGDVSTVTAAGVVTLGKVNGVSMPSSGTSGGIPFYSSTSAEGSSALLTANAVVVGGGAGTAPATITAGTNGQILVGATGAAPVMQTLGGDVSTVTAAGVVTMGKTNGISMPSSVTSGGIPFYSSTSAEGSSALLATNGVLIGGGAGAAPTSITAGTAGQLLVGAAGAPSFVTPASKLSLPANPSAVTPGTTTAQMLGLAANGNPSTLTPVATGRVYYDFTFTVLIASTANGATFQCSHGTGSAPANAANITGTQDSAAVAYLAGATTEKAIIHCAGTLTGLALSTAVWFDVAVLNTTAAQAVTPTVTTFNAFEF